MCCARSLGLLHCFSTRCGSGGHITRHSISHDCGIRAAGSRCHGCSPRSPARSRRLSTTARRVDGEQHLECGDRNSSRVLGGLVNHRLSCIDGDCAVCGRHLARHHRETASFVRPPILGAERRRSRSPQSGWRPRRASVLNACDFYCVNRACRSKRRCRSCCPPNRQRNISLTCAVSRCNFYSSSHTARRVAGLRTPQSPTTSVRPCVFLERCTGRCAGNHHLCFCTSPSQPLYC